MISIWIKLYLISDSFDSIHSVAHASRFRSNKTGINFIILCVQLFIAVWKQQSNRKLFVRIFGIVLDTVYLVTIHDDITEWCDQRFVQIFSIESVCRCAIAVWLAIWLWINHGKQVKHWSTTTTSITTKSTIFPFIYGQTTDWLTVSAGVSHYYLFATIYLLFLHMPMKDTNIYVRIKISKSSSLMNWTA